jgi:hypothetical protein
MKSQQTRYTTSVSRVARLVQEVEGFRVVVTRKRVALRPVRPMYSNYPPERGVRGDWTVARWRQERFGRYYPDLDVQVLDAYGRLVHGRRQLKTVRATYSARRTVA